MLPSLGGPPPARADVTVFGASSKAQVAWNPHLSRSQSPAGIVIRPTASTNFSVLDQPPAEFVGTGQRTVEGTEEPSLKYLRNLESCLGASKPAEALMCSHSNHIVVWRDEFKSPVGTMYPSPCSPCSYSLPSWSSYISSFASPHRTTVHHYFLSASPMSRSPMPLASFPGRTSLLLQIPHASCRPGLTQFPSVESMAW